MSRPLLVEPEALASWVAQHVRWHLDDNHLIGKFALSYNNSLDVLAMVRANIDELDHHPRVTVEYGQLTVELWTHDRGGVTSLDLQLAELFSSAVSAVSH